MSVDHSVYATAAGHGRGGDAPANVGLSLRPAAIEDATILWQWRNESQTRAMSRHSSMIPWETHIAWFTKHLANADAMTLIGLQGGEPVGVVRFDRRPDGAAEVSINIAAHVRGHGLGKRLLQRGCEHADRAGYARVFAAEVKTDNVSSRRLFEGSGFGIVSSDEEWVMYCRRNPAALEADSK